MKKNPKYFFFLTAGLVAATLTLITGCASTDSYSPWADYSSPWNNEATGEVAAVPAANAGAKGLGYYAPSNEGAIIPSDEPLSNDTLSVPAQSAAGQVFDPSLRPLTPGLTQPVSRNVATLVPPADMWDRIRRGFKMPDLDNDLVHQREQWFESHPDYLQRIADRSNRYIFYIVEELERRNMPTELALLPFVESAFNPQAVSSARAAGMWQFIPSTGRAYNLKQNIFRDDRRDVIASTNAALDYLQRLYDMFDDWQLALAAYNYGEAGVSRAIARNQSAGLPAAYSDLSLPTETQMYVPKLQALKNIVADQARFGVELPLTPNHPYFDTVTIKHDMDVSLVAQLAGVGLEDFRALNPAARKPVLLAADNPQILLPWDNAAVFQRNLQEADAQGSPSASWTARVLPRTMTVAEAARSMDMSEAELRAVNQIPPRMKIRAGSTLIIRRSLAARGDVSAAVAGGATLSLQPEMAARHMALRARRNESVAHIARRYRLKADQVAQWNRVGVNHVFRRGAVIDLYPPKRIDYADAERGERAGRSPVRTRGAVRQASANELASAGRSRRSLRHTRRARQSTANEYAYVESSRPSHAGRISGARPLR